MRILQISPFFSPQMGGSARVVFQISRQLADRGHEVSVVSGDFGLKNSQFRGRGEFKQVLLPSVVSKWGFYLTPGLMGWLRQNIQYSDIVHLHELRTFQNIIAKYYSVNKGIPYVLSAHGTLPIIVQRKLAKRVYDCLFGKSILSHANRLVAVSEAEAQEYQSVLCSGDRIRVVYNGLDLSEYSPLPRRGIFRNNLNIGDARIKVILYAGRLHRQKGLIHLILAFAELRSRGKECVLVLVGPDGGELVHLKNVIARLRLEDSAFMVGPLYGPDKLAAMVDADVLAYPAYHEIFGLVPFEALMCGTPVVVCEGSGMGQLIGQAGAGFLVPFGNATALASALEEAIDHRDQALEKVHKGQTFVRECLDWNKVIPQLENLYMEIING